METKQIINSMYKDINMLNFYSNKDKIDNKDIYNLYVSLESKMMELENQITQDIERVIDYQIGCEYSLLEECSRGN